MEQINDIKLMDADAYRVPEIILNMTKLDGRVIAFTNHGRVLLSSGDCWLEHSDYNWELP